MDQDAVSNPPAAATSMVTVKAVYCPGTSQEEIRRFNFPLPADDSSIGQQLCLYDELRRRIGAACTAAVSGECLSLYYVDSDQERVRFSTSEELVQLLRLHQSAASPASTLRILAEPATLSDADGGVEHPGIRCDGCQQGIRGRRFRCFLCPDYDLCQRCILRGVHDQHSMLVLHRPGDADSLPPWMTRVGFGFSGGFGGRGRGGGGPWFGQGGGGRGHFGPFPWQQQQQQPCQMPPQPPMQQQQQHFPFPFARATPPFGGGPPMVPPPPLSAACPKMARKLEKARYKFEAKLAKRCDRMQRKWARRQQLLQQLHHQQQRPESAGMEAAASGTADEPIRIDVEEQQQLQQQRLTPEEALLLKQLKKRHRQSAAAYASEKKKLHHHHKRGHGGRKRRRSFSSSSSSSSSSSDSSDSESSASGSSTDSGSVQPGAAAAADCKGYRQLLKKFKKMGFKDDETCWLRELIREKRGNLNDILVAIRQRKAAGAGSNV